MKPLVHPNSQKSREGLGKLFPQAPVPRLMTLAVGDIFLFRLADKLVNQVVVATIGGVLDDSTYSTVI